jgi:hypothetical protein
VKILYSAYTRAEPQERSDHRHRKHAESNRDGAGSSVLTEASIQDFILELHSRSLQVDVTEELSTSPPLAGTQDSPIYLINAGALRAAGKLV